MTTIALAQEMTGLGRGERVSAEYLLHELTTLTARLLPDCCGCTLSVWESGTIRRSSVTHPDLAVLRAPPRSAAENPDRAAMDQQQPVRIDDTLESAAYRGFCAAAAAFGIRSAVFWPVQAGRASATFGFFATRPRAFDDAGLAVTAAQAGTILQDAGYHEDLATELLGLRASLASRALIDQAIGIVMAELSCAPAEAFTELRRRSHRANVKLADLARQLISGYPLAARTRPEAGS